MLGSRPNSELISGMSRKPPAASGVGSAGGMNGE